MTPNRTAGFPADLRVRLASHSVSDFLDHHAADVSRGGIFVRHGHVLPVGRAVRLDLQLADGSVLLAGEGTVFWTREADASRSESEPGMGIRFTRLTAESQRMLTHLLAEKAERERHDDGGSDFDEDERTVVATQEELRAAAESGHDRESPAMAMAALDAVLDAREPPAKLIALPPPFAHSPPSIHIPIPTPTPALAPTPTAMLVPIAAAPPPPPVAAIMHRGLHPMLPVPDAAPMAAWEIEDAPIGDRPLSPVRLAPLVPDSEHELTDLVPCSRRSIGIGIAIGAIAAAIACLLVLHVPPVARGRALPTAPAAAPPSSATAPEAPQPAPVAAPALAAPNPLPAGPAPLPTTASPTAPAPAPAAAPSPTSPTPSPAP